jgi:hypothetical protein
MAKNKADLIDSLDDFTRAYIVCALWSSTDNSNEQGGDPLDRNYDICDIALPTLREMIRECREFQKYQAADLADWGDEQAGHDFWLTRNGHGAGFWDRGRGEQGKRLTEACRPYGEVDLYVHRGRIYAT